MNHCLAYGQSFKNNGFRNLYPLLSKFLQPHKVMTDPPTQPVAPRTMGTLKMVPVRKWSSWLHPGERVGARVYLCTVLRAKSRGRHGSSMIEWQQNLSSKLVILTPGQLASTEDIWGCHGAMVCHPNFSNLDQDTHLLTADDSNLPSAEKSLFHLLRDNTHQRPADVRAQRPGPFP